MARITGWVSILFVAAECSVMADLDCPQPMCTCKELEGIKGQATQSAVSAHCNQMPQGHMDSSITYVKLNASLNKITREMMSKTGSGLKTVDVSECGITSIEPGAFDNKTSLETLRLSGNNIDNIYPDTFGNDSSIQVLYLDGNKLVILDEAIFENLVNLLELYLQRNNLLQIPNKLPNKLRHLDISYNNISSVTTLFYQGSLKALNLCGNPFDKVAMNNSTPTNLLSLCLGDHSVALPEDIADVLPKLHNLSLIAKPETNAVLSIETESAIGRMKHLDTLLIVHYKVESLMFLHNLTLLKILKLQHITVKEGIDVNTVFTNLHYCAELFLDGSPALAQAVLASAQAMYNLTNLHYLGLRDTRLKQPIPSYVPHKSFFKMDISDNPLHCDCKMMQLDNALDSGLSHHLHRLEHTLCQTPIEAKGQPVAEYMHQLNCPTSNTSTTNEISRPLAPAEPNEHTTLYIILGVILAILVIVGIILAIIYRRYKQRNQISPCEEAQEPTFQQLKQAKSEDTLIKK